MSKGQIQEISEIRPEIETESCKFCNEVDPDALEEHHIVPKRHGGSDKESNLVTLCASCHRKIESLYDKEFYQELAEDNFECPYCGKGHENHQNHKEHVMQCFE